MVNEMKTTTNHKKTVEQKKEKEITNVKTMLKMKN